jgi:hypothetical protein
VDDRLQLPSGLGERVGDRASRRARGPFDDACSFELLETLGEHGAGDPGKAPFQLVEPVDVEEHLADDQQRPAVSDHLGALRDRAVLAVALHTRIVIASSASGERIPPPRAWF